MYLFIPHIEILSRSFALRTRLIVRYVPSCTYLSQLLLSDFFSYVRKFCYLSTNTVLVYLHAHLFVHILYCLLCAPINNSLSSCNSYCIYSSYVFCFPVTFHWLFQVLLVRDESPKENWFFTSLGTTVKTRSNSDCSYCPMILVLPVTHWIYILSA